jgi:hypothetical protein
MDKRIKITKRIHEGYRELEHTRYKIFGEYQYIYSSDKGVISLIQLINYYRDGRDGKDLWEIYCLRGDLFEDVERFDTRREADFYIREYLT